MPDASIPKKLPFAETKASKEFMPEVVKILIKEMGRRRAKFINDENIQVFSHGRGWTFQQEGREGYTPQSAEMERQQQNMVIAIDRVLEQDLTLLPNFYQTICDGFEIQLQQSMIERMTEATEQTGNSISVDANTSLADAFLQMVKTTQASIGADGKVVFSSLMITPEYQAKLLQEIEARGEEFRLQVEAAQKKQAEDAYAREKQRLSKFGDEE